MHAEQLMLKIIWYFGFSEKTGLVVGGLAGESKQLKQVFSIRTSSLN